MGHTHQHTMVGISSSLVAVVVSSDMVHRYTLPRSALVGQLADALAHDMARDKSAMRLIANGKELELHDTLESLGEFYFLSKCIHLLEVDHGACREWQRRGHCTHGSKCPHKATHDMFHSPRYVGHNLSATSSAEASPSASPESSPEVVSVQKQNTKQVEKRNNKPEKRQKKTKPEMPPGMCRNWVRNGKCRFGDKCKFVESHTPKNPLPKSAATITTPSVCSEAWPSLPTPLELPKLTLPEAALPALQARDESSLLVQQDMALPSPCKVHRSASPPNPIGPPSVRPTSAINVGSARPESPPHLSLSMALQGLPILHAPDRHQPVQVAPRNIQFGALNVHTVHMPPMPQLPHRCDGLMQNAHLAYVAA